MEIREHIKLNDRVLLTMTALLLASFFGTVFGVTQISSLAFLLSFFVVAAFFAYICAIKKSINVYLTVAVLLIIVSLLFAGIRLSFDFYKPAIIFICSLVCICVSPSVKISDTAKKTIILSVMVTALVVSVYYFFFGLGDKMYGSTDLASLNFQNPNEAAMWLMCFIVLLFGGLKVFKSIALKISSVAVAVVLFRIMMDTKSRNAIVAVLFFAFSYLIIKLFSLRSVPRWVVLLVCISPAIVFAVYMIICKIDPTVLDVVIGDDASKNLDSRVDIWTEVLDSFKFCFAVGQYGEYNLRQMHNSFATMFCQYGILVVIVVAGFMYDTVCRMQKSKSVYAALAICTVFVSGCFETSLFGGVAGLYLMFLVLPVCTLDGLKEGCANAER